MSIKFHASFNRNEGSLSFQVLLMLPNSLILEALSFREYVYTFTARVYANLPGLIVLSSSDFFIVSWIQS